MLSTYETIQISLLLSQWKILKKLALEWRLHFMWFGDIEISNSVYILEEQVCENDGMLK